MRTVYQPNIGISSNSAVGDCDCPDEMIHLLGYAHGGLEGWCVCVTEHMSSPPSPMVARRKIEDQTDTWWTVVDLSLANLAQVWESEL